MYGLDVRDGWDYGMGGCGGWMWTLFLFCWKPTQRATQLADNIWAKHTDSVAKGISFTRIGTS